MDLITVEQSENLKFVLCVRGHQIISDMEVGEGGSDSGARPTELLVGALGVCIGMAITRYCQTLGCSTRGLEICLTYQLGDRPARVENIVVDVELPADFPENRRKVLENIVHSCPVHASLEKPPDIDIEFN